MKANAERWQEKLNSEPSLKIKNVVPCSIAAKGNQHDNNPYAKGIFVFIQKVYDNNIVFLSVTMATTDPLLNTLWIPRQVEIDNQRAKL